MLTKVTTDEEIERIVKYIGDDYKAIPYLYVNIIQYGKGTDKIFAFMDLNEAGELEGAYMQYYDCIHFYTKKIEDYPVERLLDFINSHKHKVLMLQGGIGDRIEDKIDGYYSERNHVIDMDKVGLEDKEYKSEIANREDVAAIVDLLMADPEYVNVYERDVLSAQMHERFDGGFGRYFVVKMDGKVAATCSTYGEVDNFALVGGVIVHPDYRRRGLAADVENFACHVLEKENKSRVGFVNYHNTASLALHEKIGAVSVATLAKFIKK
ncbi:MAG: GNAT family N-acetyltransferase [Erysipelotrichaceae bacterium]|nr:GNAT family N-acetyltransferase [Erysipelotrichaceae bacterium]